MLMLQSPNKGFCVDIGLEVAILALVVYHHDSGDCIEFPKYSELTLLEFIACIN